MNRNGYIHIPCPTPNHSGINVAHRPCYRCGYTLGNSQVSQEAIEEKPVVTVIPGQLTLDGNLQLRMEGAV